MDIQKLKCLRCEKEWKRKKPGRANQCPFCHTQLWDRPRKIRVSKDKIKANREAFERIKAKHKLKLVEIAQITNISYQRLWQMTKGIAIMHDSVVKSLEEYARDIETPLSRPTEQALLERELSIYTNLIGGIDALAALLGVPAEKLQPYLDKTKVITREQLNAIGLAVKDHLQARPQSESKK